MLLPSKFPFSITLLLVLITLSQAVNTKAQPPFELQQFSHNKQIPAVIEKNVLNALSFYPELINTRIKFVFKKKIKSSVMQAQPVFSSLLQNKKKRQYRVNISSQFRLIHYHMPILQIPDDVMIGWIGHELGHILDYERMSNASMVSFGYNYVFYPSFVKEAERIADSLAVERGMGHYILSTKHFILDHAELPRRYKKKIAKLYLSPDVIVEQVKKLEEKKLQQNKN
jgi:hypothetical protein